MFEIIRADLLAALSVGMVLPIIFIPERVLNASTAFETTHDDAVLEKALEGFHLCAEISGRYGLTTAFDSLIVSIKCFSWTLSFEDIIESLFILSN